MLIEALVDELQAVSGLGKVYPARLPQEPVFPAVTYRVDADDRDHLVDGATSSLKRVLVDVTIWSPRMHEAHSGAEDIEAQLAPGTADYYPRQFGKLAAGITAHHGRLERKFDLFESDTQYHGVSQQFLIAYT